MKKLYQEQQYLDLIQRTMDTGTLLPNRTGEPAISIPGACMTFDVSNSFPAVTTKKLAFKSVVGELCGFLRAKRSAADFRALGCKVWDQNANENQAWLNNPYRTGEDDLGPVYGAQWRQWEAYKFFDMCATPKGVHLEEDGWDYVGSVNTGPGDSTGDLWHKKIDQLRQCLDTIMTNPTSRRILFHGWNPAVLDEIALPACHLLYQFIPNPTTKEMSLVMYIRSNDLFLGAPFNIAEATALLYLVCHLTGYTPKWYTHMIGDCHIYRNHMEQARIQVEREPYIPPTLVISDRIPKYADTGKYEPDWLDFVHPDDFELIGYLHHPPLPAPMAV